ncbi:MAG: hypothetical protein HN742_36525 [Lentisphaerae bacterium]|jgi:uncharacterized protein|nr:hypothetical protein [Lentisphaerota bacterium]MBT4819623.1 hypothetical protein [Lentisphaerota bacterium]MBT5604428.1 hypothetical protein [Lentisphaerota bacterium]MBT7058185.1 hypothetical protein [Lentisphaerota bacterium]MBT7847431.1 hypothetical protein [Lentisphaerota bacterium]
MRLLPKLTDQWLRTGPRRNTKTGDSAFLAQVFELRVGQSPSAGQRIVFFSDLHWDNNTERGAEDLVQGINQLAGDWIIFGGDLSRYQEQVPSALRILAAMEARRNKLAVPGNRESIHSWLSDADWRERYEAAGFHYLRNTVLRPPGKNAPIFVGIDDCRFGDVDLSCVPESEAFTVLISHSPDSVGRSATRFIGHLVLAGHTHGGQIRLPVIGPLFTSSAYWRTFDMGWYQRHGDGTRMYITTGTGVAGSGLLRRRLLCPPEIVAIDLVAG